MKIYAFLVPFLFSVAFSGKAQIMLTNEDIAYAGVIICQVSDTLPDSTIVSGNAGEEQIWDFSALHIHSEDSLYFGNPDTTEYGAYFSSANLACMSSVVNIYINNSSSSLVLVGSAGKIIDTMDAVTLQVSPPDTMLKFPASYQDSYSGDYGMNASAYVGQSVQGLPVDSVRLKSNIHKTSVFDAWGTVITPVDQYLALRENLIESRIDSIFAYINLQPFYSGWMFFVRRVDTAYSYNWWAKTIGKALIEMNYNNDNGVVTSVSWVKSSSAERKEIADADNIGVYPNPVISILNINTQGNLKKKIIISDIIGKTVYNLETSENNIKIPVYDLTDGLYLLTVRYENGCTNSMKIIKSH